MAVFRTFNGLILRLHREADHYWVTLEGTGEGGKEKSVCEPTTLGLAMAVYQKEKAHYQQRAREEQPS